MHTRVPTQEKQALSLSSVDICETLLMASSASSSSSSHSFSSWTRMRSSTVVYTAASLLDAAPLLDAEVGEL